MRLKNEHLRSGAIIFIIIYSVMPIVSRMVSTYLTTYFYMLFILVFLVIAVGKRKKSSFLEYISDILPFILFGLASYFLNKDSILIWGYKLLLFLTPVIVGIYITQYYPDDSDTYSKVFVLALIITVLTTIRGLGIYPNAARWMATADDSQVEKLVTYSWMNIGGYEFVYTVVLTYPLLVLAFKRGMISIFKTTVLSVIIFICLLRAEYTTALIFFIITTSMYFMKKSLKPKDLAIFVIVAVLFVTFFSGAVSNMLKSISGLVESKNVSERVEALSEGRKGMEESEDIRWKMYSASLNSFFRRPLLGSFLTGGGGAGGHSFALDTMAQYGIIGILLMFFMYRKLFRLFYRKYHGEDDHGYIVWIFAQAVLLSIINTGMWLEVLAFYVPVVLYAIYGGGKVDEENSLDSEYIADSNQH